MLAVSIIMGILGVLVSVVAYQIWGMKKIHLLHSFYYEKVSEEDKNAFCNMWGIGMNLIGAGLLITGIIAAFTKTTSAFIAVEVGVLFGLILMILAGARYNN